MCVRILVKNFTNKLRCRMPPSSAICVPATGNGGDVALLDVETDLDDAWDLFRYNCGLMVRALDIALLELRDLA